MTGQVCPNPKCAALWDPGARECFACGYEPGDGDRDGWPPPGEPPGDGDAASQPESRLDELRGALVDSAGLDKLPVPESLIDGLLARDSLAWLHGKPGHCKTLIALDWSCCVGAGLPWQGRAVTAGPVLYVIAEGASGLLARVRAWEDNAGERTSVLFLPVAIQLRRGDFPALAALAAELGCALVVIDTQARVTVGADENSAVDMGHLVVAADKVRAATGACVLVLHHESRAGENMRGSTALEGRRGDVAAGGQGRIPPRADQPETEGRAARRPLPRVGSAALAKRNRRSSAEVQWSNSYLGLGNCHPGHPVGLL